MMRLRLFCSNYLYRLKKLITYSKIYIFLIKILEKILFAITQYFLYFYFSKFYIKTVEESFKIAFYTPKNFFVLKKAN